jgi:hypothetical protein
VQNGKNPWPARPFRNSPAPEPALLYLAATRNTLLEEVMKKVLLVGVFAALSAGCTEGLVDASLNAEAAVSFAVAGSSGLLGSNPPENPIQIGSHTIMVNSVDLRVTELELEGDDSAKTELRGSTILVALPVNGSVVTPINARLSSGIFSEFEMDVRTVRIRGTFDDSPFDVTVDVNDELEMSLFPPLVVEADGAANLTVTVLMENWFRNSDGSAIDLLHMSSSVESRLAGNIKGSFDAFEDDDRDAR